MQRISRGLKMAGQSWRVIMREPQLLVIVAVAVLAQIAIFAVYVSGVIGWHSLAAHGRWNYLRLYPILFPTTLLSTFGAAVVTAVVAERMDGREATWRDGLGIAARRLPVIALWALIASTVGVVLQAIEERLGFIMRIVVGLIGVAWSVATALVVPVLIVERKGAVESVKRSAGLIKKTWGEEVSGQAGIGLALFVLAIPFAVAAAFLAIIGIGPAIAAELVIVVMLMSLSAALASVFQVVVYRYAATGEIAEGFDPQDVSRVFRRRGSWRDSGGSGSTMRWENPHVPSRPVL